MDPDFVSPVDVAVPRGIMADPEPTAGAPWHVGDAELFADMGRSRVMPHEVNRPKFATMSDLEPVGERHPGWDLAIRLGLGTRGEAVVKFLDARQARRGARAARAYEAAAQASGKSGEELFDVIEHNERLGDVFEETMSAASRTSWDAKLQSLGRALAQAVTAADDATIDRSELLGRAIADIEPIHARALWLFGRRRLLNPGKSGLDGTVADAFPSMAPVASQIAAVLTRHGLVTEPFYANGVVGLTDFGREILQMLIDAGGVHDFMSEYPDP